MKECPICHELNEDNQDTCKKCHASLDFKIYRADEKSNIKGRPKCYDSNSLDSMSKTEKHDYAIDKNTVVKYFDLVCDNECQENIEAITHREYNNHNLFLQTIENGNSTDIVAYVDEMKVGYLPKEKIHFFMLKDATYEATELFIENDNNIFYAKISVVFSRVINLENDKQNNDFGDPNKIRINNNCIHCGSEKVNNSTLCNKCKVKKFFLMLLFTILALILAFFCTAIISAFLTAIFGEQKRYGVGGAMTIGFVMIAINKVRSIFNNPNTKE